MALVFSVVSENATSSAVIGLPSWKVMPSRKRNLLDAAIGRDRDLVGCIGIDRIGLVGRPPHQRGKHLLHVDRGIAFEDEALNELKVAVPPPASWLKCRLSGRRD